MHRSPLRAHACFAVFATLALSLAGCPKEEKREGAPPPGPKNGAPPPAASGATSGASAAAGPGPCASGGGEVKDDATKAFFPKAIAGWCLDPQWETKSYGDKAKFTKDKLCTTAMDGGCEAYLKGGLVRLVMLSYIDGSGKGGSVEVKLTQFDTVENAFERYTRTLIDEQDPANPNVAKPLDEKQAKWGALGTGAGYGVKGNYFVEFSYSNETETPEQLKANSAKLLPELTASILSKLPGEDAAPGPVLALPTDKRLPMGILFKGSDPWFKAQQEGATASKEEATSPVMIKGTGPLALGFYKDGDKRWRILSAVRKTEELAKDAFKAFKSRPGATTLKGPSFDEGVMITFGGANAPKQEFYVARKGAAVFGVGDDEYALTASTAAKVGKDEAFAKLAALFAATK